MKTESTELNKKEPVLAVNHMVDWIDQGKDVTSDICYKWLKIAFREGQSNPKIKQLEWKYLKSYYRSDSNIYKYAITHANDFKTDVGLYSLLINGEFLNYYAELDEAKQFAQADFERRIKKCLITE